MHADRVHHCKDVIGLLLKRRRVPDPVREADSARLHVDRSGERRAALVQLMNGWVGPGEIEVLKELAHDEDVRAAVPHDLICQEGAVPFEVLSLGGVHAEMLREGTATS